MADVYKQKQIFFELMQFGQTESPNSKLAQLEANVLNDKLKSCYSKHYELSRGQSNTLQDNLDADENHQYKPLTD